MSGSLIIRADGNTTIGMGHLERCATLAGAYAHDPSAVTFVVAETPGPLIDRLRAQGFNVATLAQNPLTEQQDAERFLAYVTTTARDWVIVDSYALGGRWEQHVGQWRPVLAIDDLPCRPHDCALLLDQTFGRRAEDYARLVNPDCQVLAGTRYALVKPEFRLRRDAALQARQHTPEPPIRVLVSLGGSNQSALLEALVVALLDSGHEVDLVAPPEQTQFAAALTGVRCWWNLPSLADLMCDCDLAVGGAGTTTWERCVVGLPTAMVVLADNQRDICQQVVQAGGGLDVGSGQSLDLNRLTAALNQMLADYAGFVSAAAAICDGGGVNEVCATMKTALPVRADP